MDQESVYGFLLGLVAGWGAWRLAFNDQAWPRSIYRKGVPAYLLLVGVGLVVAPALGIGANGA